MPDDFKEQLRKQKAAEDDRKQKAALKEKDKKKAEKAAADEKRLHLETMDRELTSLLNTVKEVYEKDRAVRIELPTIDPNYRVFRVRRGKLASLTFTLDMKNLEFSIEQQPEYGTGPNGIFSTKDDARMPSRAIAEDLIKRFLANPDGRLSPTWTIK